MLSVSWSYLTSEWFWLPPGWHWHTLPHYAADGKFLLTWPFAVACVILVVRTFLVERFIFDSLARYLRIDDTKPKKPKANPVLEVCYKRYKRAREADLSELGKKVDMNVKEVSNWIRQRLRADKASTFQKFTECGWRVVFYTFSSLYGCYVMWDKSWTWDLTECFRNLPLHEPTLDIKIYYGVELGFYWAQLATCLSDVQRSDSKVLAAHHIITIWLISFSWISQLWRIGTFILLIMDVSDIFLDLAKMLKYSNNEGLATISFATFFLSWVVCRLIIYPWKVLGLCLPGPCMYTKCETMWPSFAFLATLLVLLFVLQLFWTFLILRVLIELVTTKTADDVRSDEED